MKRRSTKCRDGSPMLAMDLEVGVNMFFVKRANHLISIINFEQFQRACGTGDDMTHHIVKRRAACFEKSNCCGAPFATLLELS